MSDFDELNQLAANAPFRFACTVAIHEVARIIRDEEDDDPPWDSVFDQGGPPTNRRRKFALIMADGVYIRANLARFVLPAIVDSYNDHGNVGDVVDELQTGPSANANLVARFAALVDWWAEWWNDLSNAHEEAVISADRLRGQE